MTTTSPVMTLTDELLSELEDAAKGATPGPWIESYRESNDGLYRHQTYTPDGETVASFAWYPREMGSGITQTYRADNAKFSAAANPATVLALIARVREVEKDAARYRWLRRRVCITGTGGREVDFEIIDMPAPRGFALRADIEFDAAIDAAMPSPQKGFKP